MRKLIAVLLGVLALASPVLAQQTQKFAWSVHTYDWTATSYTYCSLLGERGDPFGSALRGPAKVKTTGSSTTVVEATESTDPFAALAVGDVLFVRRGAANTVTDRVSITAKASDAEITVSSAVDWSAGYDFAWLDLVCGTTTADGWFFVGTYDEVDFTVAWDTKNATSLDAQAQCKVQDGSPVTVKSVTISATGTTVLPITSGVYDRCRLGLKLNTDTGAQSITSYVASTSGTTGLMTADKVQTVLYAELGDETDGTLYYCVDCTAASPCADSGGGAFAFRVAGAWECTSSGGAGAADPAQFSSGDGSIVVGGIVGGVTFEVDGSIIPNYASGAGDPGATCAIGDIYLETDTFEWYDCVAANTWALRVGANLTATTGFGFVIDDDSMATASDTTLPTSESVKAYVDASGGGSTFDPSTTLTIYCDFLSGLATTGNLGECGANFSAVATGTLSQTIVAPAANPGVVRLNSHATNDNSGINLILGNGATAGAINTAVWAGKDWSVDAIVIFGSNSTAITDTSLFVGLGNALATDPMAQSALVGIRHDSDLSDTTFVFVVCDSATDGCGSAGDDTNQKVVASTITPAAGTAYRFRIRRATSGVGGNPTLYFRVNDEAEKTFCSAGCDDDLTQLAAANFLFLTSYLTRTTTGVLSSDVDYMYMTIPGLVRY